MAALCGNRLMDYVAIMLKTVTFESNQKADMICGRLSRCRASQSLTVIKRQCNNYFPSAPEPPDA